MISRLQVYRTTNLTKQVNSEVNQVQRKSLRWAPSDDLDHPLTLPFSLCRGVASSSFSFLRDGDSAAIAEEPQIAVPNPTRIPVEPGQLNFSERKYPLN